MADIPLPGRNSIEVQADLFRLAKRDYGLSLEVIAANSPLKLGTLKGWQAGAAMPAWAIGALGTAGVPDHLLSMLLEPFGKHVGTDESDDGDLDALGREGAHFLAEKADAEADGVVTHIERAGLKNRARRIAGVARRAAA